MATMFRKPRRNFRKKVTTESDSEEDHDDKKQEDVEMVEQNDAIPQFDKPKKVKKKKKDKDKNLDPPNLLSFDDEGDVEVFKVKKTSHSKRIAKQIKRERLVEQHRQKTLQEKSTQDGEDESPPVDSDQIIKKLREEFSTLNGEDAEALDEDSGEDEKGVLRKILGKGEIPDANTIHLIRKKRQLARDTGDFIPVDDKKTVDSSRLVREDDNDKSDEDDEGRIDFTINTAEVERQRIKDEFLAAEHGSDDENDDQLREWEAMQIKKGVAVVGQVQEAGTMEDDSTGYSNGFPDNFKTDPVKFEPLQPLAKLTNTAQINMETIRKRLQERMESMNEVHRSHLQEKETLVSDIENSQQDIDTCENSVKDLEKHYRFFQEMRGYVRDLVECLNEKVPFIDDLETRMMTTLRSRSEKLKARRQQDVRDQCQDYMTNKSNKIFPETTEDYALQRRVAEREARRARRRRARENSYVKGHHEGLSSDDEENQSDLTKFTLEKENARGRVEHMFVDVEEDFSEVQKIRERFEEWKEQYDDSYKEAYIGLTLPKLFNPFVRLQMVDWNPLQGRGKEFEESRWFEALVFYGCRSEDSLQKDNDDVKLLPSIIEKTILPKLTTLTETVWDPLSTTQTSRLVNTVQHIINDYPCSHVGNKAMQSLLHAITKQLQKALDDDVFMPLYPKSVTENRSSEAAIFFHRQSWSCIKLLGNILSWHGIIATNILQGLALDGLLNRYIILGLCNSVVNMETIQKCQSIVSTFPREWFSDLDSDKTLPQLENLCKYMVSAAKVIEKESSKMKDSEKRECREQIKQINKLLVTVHAMDHALSLQS